MCSSDLEDWSSPHYEKLLRINLELFRNCIEVYQVTGKAQWKDLALSQYRFLNNMLQDPEGGYFAAQAAQGRTQGTEPLSPGENYFALNAAERKKVAPPPIDQSFFSELNSMAVNILLTGSVSLDNDSMAQEALKIYQRLERVWDNTKGMPRGVFPNKEAIYGLLQDNVRYLLANLALFQYSGQEKYLSQGLMVAQWIKKNLLADDGGYWDSRADETSLQPNFSTEKVLQENAMVAQAFFVLGELLHDHQWNQLGEQALIPFLENYTKHSYRAASYATAIQYYTDAPLLGNIIAKEDNGERTAFAKAMFSAFSPGLIVRYLSLKKDKALLGELKITTDEPPLCLITWQQFRSAPITNPDYVKITIEKMSEKITPNTKE